MDSSTRKLLKIGGATKIQRRCLLIGMTPMRDNGLLSMKRTPKINKYN